MYAHCFKGDLAGFHDALVAVLPTAPLVLDGKQLREPAIVDDLLDRFANANACHERRATASQWSKYVFSRLGIAVTVVQMTTGRALDVDLDRLRIAWSADGLPISLAGHAPRTGVDGANFDSLLDGAFAPLIETLNACCGLAPRIFASNATMYFAWALAQLRAQGDAPAARIAAAEALMRQRRRGDRRNPLYAPFKDLAPGARDGDGEPVTRCRRLCCVRDLDAQWGLCANCPRAIVYADPLTATG